MNFALRLAAAWLIVFAAIRLLWWLVERKNPSDTSPDEKQE